MLSQILISFILYKKNCAWEITDLFPDTSRTHSCLRLPSSVGSLWMWLSRTERTPSFVHRPIYRQHSRQIEQAVGGSPPRYAPAPRSTTARSGQWRRICCGPYKLWFEQATKAAWWPWPLNLKVVSESRVTRATPVPILVFLGLSVLDLGPMYVTDKRTSDSIIA